MTAEQILNKVKSEDRDKLYSPYISDSDYAGGSRHFIREDLCIEAINLSRQSLLQGLKEKIGESILLTELSDPNDIYDEKETYNKGLMKAIKIISKMQEYQGTQDKNS